MAPSRNTESVASPGTAAGFRLHSNLTFQTLRTGGGTPLSVDERDDLESGGEVVAVWQARPDNPFHGRLHQDRGRFSFWTSDAGWYRIAPEDRTISVSPQADTLRRELRLFGIPTAVCAFVLGDLAFHAAAVDIGGVGILLGGPTRHGKTTLAAGFAAAGYRLLAEDTVRCTLDDAALVYPGPSVVRLRADVAPHLDLEGAVHADTAQDAGRVPLVFPRSQRGSGEPIPLAAVVMLQGAADNVELRPVTPPDAIRDLFSLAFRFPTAASRAVCFERVADLIASVEVLGLRRPVTIEALPDVVATIAEHLARARIA